MRWLPRSLLGRVFALYAFTLMVMALVGLGIFLAAQVSRQVEDTQRDADALLAMAAPVVADAAVIGDYDAIKRQLETLARHSTVSVVAFADSKGGRLQSRDDALASPVPSALVRWFALRLGEPTRAVLAGGTSYGELRLTPAAHVIAGQVWQQAWAALALALAAVGGGMLLIRRPLVRWLGPLERIGQLGTGLEGGGELARDALRSDAPIEFRQTFEVLNRAASNLQAQREQAAATLQAIDDAVPPTPPRALGISVNEDIHPEEKIG